nr:DUF1349 domain-containing protein [Calycomorphotria hydatis]
MTSDDFSNPELSRELWQFVDPHGDSQVSFTGSHAEITVAEGRSHDLWTNSLWAPRLLQAVNNTDFEIEVKYDSVVQAQYQLQGLVAQADDKNLVRFDVYSDGNTTRLFAAKFTNGIATKVASQSISSTGPIYLRLTRNGDTWTARYSSDGQAWYTFATFTYSLSITRAGFFVGNHGSNGAVPGFTGRADYFRVHVDD